MGSSPQQQGRVAAIDYGRVRIGLAVSDELRAYAHPRPALDGRNLKATLEKLRDLADEENVERFVVGLPLSMSGEVGKAAERVMKFCQKLADATGREVELLDERLTSVQAERMLADGGAKSRRDMRGQVDSAAAAILLEQWLAGAR